MKWKQGIIRINAIVLTISMILLNGIPNVRAEESDKKEESKSAGVELNIDSDNCYEGMDKSYSEGYVPHVENGTVNLIVPLLSSEALKNEQIRVSLELGEGADIPFVCKNYSKKVGLTNGCYLVNFPLELKAERINGSYPVTMTVKGSGESAGAFQSTFTVFVSITDGVNPTAQVQEEEPPAFQPKVLVESYTCSAEQVIEGQQFDLTITLRNTNKDTTVKNLTIVANTVENFELISPSDSVYVSSVNAGKTCTATYSYRVKKGTLQGQYDIPLTLEYADPKGNPYSAEGHAKVSICQDMQMQFDQLQLGSELRVADTVNASIQAINLGRSKVYNVRAQIESDGLNPMGTIFIGDMEAGTSGTGNTQVIVTALKNGSSTYGDTTGKVIYYYEDEAGNEYSEEKELTITVLSPFEGQEEKEQDHPGQWWWIMAIVGAMILVAIITIVVRTVIIRRKQETQLDEGTDLGERIG